MNEEEKRKKLEEIRKAVREGRIKFASWEQVEYLQSYIDQILTAIAKVTDNEHVVKAFVSDESSLGDFQTIKQFRPVLEYEHSYPEFVRLVGEELGIEIDPQDKKSHYLVEIAKKLAHG